MRRIAFQNSLIGVCCLLVWPSLGLLGQQLPPIAAPTAWKKVVLENGPYPKGRINCLLQDRLGFLWVGGSKGLYRFDGYEFKAYLHDPSDAKSMSSDHVSTLLEGSDGDLWVGTFNGGLNRYHRSMDNFSRYAPQGDGSSGLSDVQVNDICLDRDGSLWVATFGGLDHLLPVAGTDSFGFQHFRQGSGSTGGLPSNKVVSVAQDGKGDIWVAMEGAGIAWMRNGPSKEAAATEFVQYLHRPADSSSLGSDRILEVLFDKEGSLHVSHSKGISIAAAGNDREAPLQFKTYSDEALDPNRRQTQVQATYFDPDGGRWLVSAWGIHRATPDGYISYHLDEMGAVSQGSNVVYAMLVTQDGVIWVGTQEGLYRSQNGRTRFHAVPISAADGPTTVTAVIRDHRGQTWIGFEDNGLLVLDQGFHPYARFRHDVHNPGSLQSDFVMTLLEDSRERIWVGTYGGGMHIAEPERDGSGRVSGLKFQRLFTAGNPAAALPDPYNYACMEASDHRIWVGSFYGMGYWKERQGRLHEWPAYVVNSVLEDGEGRIWAGTDRGIYTWDTTGDSMVKYRCPEGAALNLDEQMVTELAVDHLGHIWAGTAMGLVRLPRDRHDAGLWLRSKGGFPEHAVRAMVADGRHRLWVSTSGGLAALDVQAGELRTYGLGDGTFNASFSMRAAHRDSQGWLYFGGTDGLTRFHPDSLQPLDFDPPILLTRFRLFNRPLLPQLPNSAVRGLPRAIPLLDTVHLTHAEKVFTVEFAALDYRQSMNMRYRHRMEGFEDEWQWTDPGQHSATYSNLDPGTYCFRVRAVHPDGRESPREARLYVVIWPPWWRTPLAYAAYVLLTMAGVGLVFRLRLRTVQREMQVKVRIAEARAAERDQVRARSSRDFHDEAGTKLTRMSLYVALLRQQAGEAKEMLPLLDKIEDNLQGLSAGMRDFIWVLDPRHDNFPDLLLRLAQFGGELFHAAGIDFRYQNEAKGTGDTRPDVRTKRHLLLIFKEAMHNAVRHAACTHVVLRVAETATGLDIRLSDDGRGFDEPGLARINGIRNMRERAAEIGARLELQSAPGKGTTLSLILPWGEDRA